MLCVVLCCVMCCVVLCDVLCDVLCVVLCDVLCIVCRVRCTLWMAIPGSSTSTVLRGCSEQHSGKGVVPPCVKWQQLHTHTLTCKVFILLSLSFFVDWNSSASSFSDEIFILFIH